MYDDLARTQRLSRLEWVALNVVIPSLTLTLLMHLPPSGSCQFVSRPLGDVTAVMLGVIEPPEAGILNPDVPPRIAWLPEPEYPSAMFKAGTEGHVVVRALVDARGRIRPATIRVLVAAHPEFADAVRKALTAAQFQPALFAGTRIDAWVTFSIYFDIYSVSYYEE